MTRLFAWLFAAALVLGLGAAPTLTYAADQETKSPMEEAEEGGPDSGDKKEADMKEGEKKKEETKSPIEEAEGE